MARETMTTKQQRFAQEYLADGNATQAALRAGYSKKAADSIGIKNLKNPLVKEYIRARREEMQEQSAITRERVIAELAKIGFDEATDFAVGGKPLVNAQYKTTSKIRALELLGKHLGVFESKEKAGTDEGGITIVDDIP